MVRLQRCRSARGLLADRDRGGRTPRGSASRPGVSAARVGGRGAIIGPRGRPAPRHSRTVRVIDRLERGARRAPSQLRRPQHARCAHPGGPRRARSASSPRRGGGAEGRRWRGVGPGSARWLGWPSRCSRTTTGRPHARWAIAEICDAHALRARRRPLPGHARGRRGGVSALVGLGQSGGGSSRSPSSSQASASRSWAGRRAGRHRRP